MVETRRDLRALSDRDDVPATQLEVLSGSALGAGVLGVVTLASTVAILGWGLDVLGGVLIMLIGFGVGTWVFTRRQEPRNARMSRLPWVGDRSPFVQGLIAAAGLAIWMVVACGLLAWATSPEGILPLIPGMLLGTSLLNALQVRDHRRRATPYGDTA